MSNNNNRIREPLYALAASLNNIFFPDDGGILAASFFEQESLGCIRHYLKRPTRNRMLWTVRIFIGGKVRCIGATERGCDAARFADMAACRFAKYRRRAAAADSGNLNFTIEQVRADEFEVPEATELLNLVEEYFLSNGVILEPEAEKPIKRGPRGLKSDLLTLHAEVMLALAAIRVEIAKLQPLPLDTGGILK